ADHALQPRAPLLFGEHRDLVEIDLLQQPPAVVADALRRAVGVAPAVGDDAVAEPHYDGSVALRVTRRRSSPRPGTTIGMRTLSFAASPLILTSTPPRSPPGSALRAAFAASPPRASTRLAVRAAF